MNALPTQFAVGEGPVILNATQVDVDAATGRALAIERIRRGGSGSVPRRRHDVASDPVVPPSPSTVDLHTPPCARMVLEPAAVVAGGGGRRPAPQRRRPRRPLGGPRADRRSWRTCRTRRADLLPGVEIDCLTGDVPNSGRAGSTSGLGVDPTDDALEATLVRQRDRRRVR
jgi:hypothetical protein